jgi:hypothetical protein
LEVYLIKYISVKNGVFGNFEVKKCRKPPILAPYLYISGGGEAYLPPLTPSTTTPAQALPLPIVGFVSEPSYSLLILLSEGTELPTTAKA